MTPMLTMIVAFAASLVAFVLIGLVITRLYTRATQDTAFVRTGFGGAKVIVEGGALVLPVLHERREVSLKTHKLEVSRRQTEALITKDSLRADVTVEFFVRVEKEAESIKVAAQTLGDLTKDPAELKKLVEGKFVDALRSAAATMDLSELHQNRPDFVQKARQAANEDLKKNGLELESVSLVGLDQTDPKFFNPSNTFDAAGLAKIAQITEAKRRERFDIEQSTEVAIAERAREAKMKTLEIDRDTRNAEITQEQEIATAKAASEAATAERQADARRLAEQARIKTDQEIAASEVASKLAIDLANQQRETQVAEQSKQKSAAEAEASEARATAVKAEEKIETARAVEKADRQKQVELVEARKVAEKNAIGVTVAAQAEKDSAVTRAEAIQTVAEAEAKAEITRADAKAKTYEVEAEGTRKVNEAQNVISETIVEMQVRMKVIEVLPQIISASVKPLESIESIKIVDVGGLNGIGGGQIGADGNREGGSLPDQLTNAALRHRAVAPLVDSLLSEVGITGGAGSVEALTSVLKSNIAPAAKDAPQIPAPKVPKPDFVRG